MLVTGGCGFIGSAFAKRAASAGNRVVVLDAITYAADLTSLAGRNDIEVARGNITDTALVVRLLQEHQIDTVVNFAAESHVDRSIAEPDTFMQTNILGVFSLLNASLARFQQLSADDAQRFRFVQISTDEVFGSLGENGLFTEESPYDPRSPYSASKAAADHLVSAWHHTYGLPIILTNCSNNYGPWQFPEKLMPVVIQRALAQVDIPLYGDGENIRDWLFVEDHVDALLLAAAKGIIGRSYCVGGNSERTNKQVVHNICELLDELNPNGAPHDRLITPVSDRPGHDRRYAIDSTKIREELGWQPVHNFESGLRATVSWYMNNQKWCGDVSKKSNYSGERIGIIASNKV